MGRQSTCSGLVVSLLLVSAFQFYCAYSPLAKADSVPPRLLDSTPPVAIAGPDQIVDEGTTVQFDGSASHDDVGIVNFTWTFMDGGPVALFGIYPTFRFVNHGIFVVTLKVKDAADLNGTDSVTITVQEPPEAMLTTHENGDKRFRIGIPVAWDVDMNFNDPDMGEVDLLAWGPREGGYYTNILVISDSMSVSESDVFLLGMADATLEDIRFEYGSIRVTMEPRIIATVNSRAVVFSYHDDNESLWQFVGMIVSDEHIRVWTIVMTADSSYAGEYDELAQQVTASFELLPPKSQDSTGIFLGIIIVIVLVGAVIGIIMWQRRKAKAGAEYPLAALYGAQSPHDRVSNKPASDPRRPQQPLGGNTCPYCGVVSFGVSRVCPNCGRIRP